MSTNDFTPAPDKQVEYALEKQVGFLLRQAVQRHTAIFTEVMGPEITAVQWSTLITVDKNGAISQNQLGREIGVDQATIKGVIDRLAQKGFISTQPDPADGRRRVIKLTLLGSDIVRNNLAKAREITIATLSPLTEAEQGILTILLDKLR